MKPWGLEYWNDFFSIWQWWNSKWDVELSHCFVWIAFSIHPLCYSSLGCGMGNNFLLSSLLDIKKRWIITLLHLSNMFSVGFALLYFYLESWNLSMAYQHIVFTECLFRMKKISCHIIFSVHWVFFTNHSSARLLLLEVIFCVNPTSMLVIMSYDYVMDHILLSKVVTTVIEQNTTENSCFSEV